MVSEVDKAVAYKVRFIRQSASLSISEAAEASGLDPQVYVAIESGKRRFQSHELLKITKALNVSIADLYQDLP